MSDISGKRVHPGTSGLRRDGGGNEQSMITVELRPWAFGPLGVYALRETILPSHALCEQNLSGDENFIRSRRTRSLKLGDVRGRLFTLRRRDNPTCLHL